MSTVTYPKVARIKSLDNLFIELTSKSCNQKCNQCYIDFPRYKKQEDFIDINLVKETLKDIENIGIKCIYLTGAEPMIHPDFNLILRMCLKVSNVCICTNGSLINEKKSRFLRKVEDESHNEIIFRLSFVHYDELKNDDIRYRGAFRHTLFAYKALLKYGFNPIITVSNFYKEDETSIFENFKRLFSKMDMTFNDNNFQINPWHFYDRNTELFENKSAELDCEYGRVLTSNGIFSCPFLSNDYRGRCGNSFKDFSDKCTLETDFCLTCMSAKNYIFGVDFSKFT